MGETLQTAGRSRGILSGTGAEALSQRVRVLPSADLAPYVHHFWSGRWAFSAPRVAEALPYPCVSLLFETIDGVHRTEVAAPRTGRVTRSLHGSGEVFGVTFRPAAFGAPFFSGPLANYANQAFPIGDVFGPAGEAWSDALHREPAFDAKIALATSFLHESLPPLSTEARHFRDIVEQIAVDRTLLRVEDICAATNIDIRALQRGFHRYVGVTPKWALQRFRLIEAVERLKSTQPPTLSELAASLKYSDQAHFARDFKRVVGETPRHFTQRTHPTPLP